MKVTILCSSADHPINTHLEEWFKKHRHLHEIDIVRRSSDLSHGDILFLVSCAEKIGSSDREKYNKALVIHASDLPLGRGWSPHVWQIIAGARDITMTLLEAEDTIDTGPIWHKISISVPVGALCNEINKSLFDAEIELLDYAVENFHRTKPRPQDAGVKPSYFVRRTPSDSRIDPEKSISSQFNLLRVCDENRYPAFFELNGRKYIIRLEKGDD